MPCIGRGGGPTFEAACGKLCSALRFNQWTAILACRYNGRCGSASQAAAYGDATRAALTEFGAGFWTVGNSEVVEVSKFSDIDGDGRADLIGISGPDNGLTAYRNQGWDAVDLIVGWDRRSLVSGFGDASRMTFADMDGDGLADLINVNGPDNGLTAYRNQGNSAQDVFVGWDRKHIVSGFGPLTGVKFADMDGDGRADLIGASGVANDLTAYRNQG